jgi:hypothetical protein
VEVAKGCTFLLNLVLIYDIWHFICDEELPGLWNEYYVVMYECQIIFYGINILFLFVSFNFRNEVVLISYMFV